MTNNSDNTLAYELSKSKWHSALLEKIIEKGETLEDIKKVTHYQPPFHCNSGKYYSQLVVASNRWFYACNDNAGYGIQVGASKNPEHMKPEAPPGYIVATMCSATTPYRLIKVANN